MKITALFAFALIACTGNLPAENLLPGDTDVEVECRNMTQGTWGASIHGNPERLNFAWDNQAAHQGKRSVKVFSNSEVSVNEVRNLTPGKYTFSVWARSSQDGVKGFIGVTPFQRSTWTARLNNRTEINLSPQWKEYQYTFSTDDKNWYVPTYGVLSTDGEAFFDTFMLQSGGSAGKWQNSAPAAIGINLPVVEANTFYLGEEIPVTISSRSDDHDMELKITVADYLNKPVKSYTGKNLGNQDYKFQIPAGRRGWFGITAQLLKNNKVIASDFQSLVIVKPPEKLASNVEPFAGMAAELSYPEAYKRVGVRWIESHVVWTYAERQKGIYDYNYLLHYDRIKKYKEMGFYNKTLFNTWAPDWAYPAEIKKIASEYKLAMSRFLPPAETNAAWRDMFKDFLGKYSQYVDIYEVGAEVDAAIGLNNYYKHIYANDLIDGFALGKSATEYAEMVKIATEEIRKVNPQAKISVVRPSDVDSRYDYAYTGAILKLCGQSVNCLGIDCYPSPRWIGPGQQPAGLESNLKKNYDNASKVMQKYAQANDIFVSEYGYFIDYLERNNLKYQLEQANRLARSFLYAKACNIKSFFYYAGYYPANSLEAERFSMSIWDRGLPLRAVAAYSASAEIVENVVESKFITLAENLTAIVYRKADQSAVAALWSTSRDYMPIMELDAANITVCDMMGNQLSPEANNGRIKVQLQEEPIYIWRRQDNEDNYALLNEVINRLKVMDDIPASLFFRHDQTDSLKIYMQNRSLKYAQAGSVRYSGGEQKFQIPSGDSIQVNIPLEADKTRLEFKFKGDYAPLTYEYAKPEIVAIPFSKDGFDLTGRKPVVMNTKDRIMPPDVFAWHGPDDLSCEFYLAHDGEFLYVTAVVTDDLHFNKFNGNMIWKGDCVQLGFDPKTNSMKIREGLDSDDTVLTMALAGSEPVLVVHEGLYKQSLSRNSQLKIARDEPNKKTIYQLKLPLKFIDNSMKSKKVFGFNLVAWDDDSGAGADYWMFYKQGLAGERRPDKFGLFVLE